MINGVVMSRSLKPIPNQRVQRIFKQYENYDGELIVGAATAKDCYRRTVSGVMSYEGDPDVFFWVFDHVRNRDDPYYPARHRALKSGGNVRVLGQEVCHTLAEVLEFEYDALTAGYEGIMLRDPTAPYKCGRSTLNEGILMKLKRFVDDEAVVVGFEEKMHNANEATTNELGKTHRSSHKANQVPMNTLGALVVKWHTVTFGIGTGFSDQQRLNIWQNRKLFLGRLAKFKYLPVGVKAAPRHPVWLGFRNKIDVA